MAHFILLVFLTTFFTSPAIATTYNVVSLGAKPDGQTDSSKAFLSAWASACGSSGPSSIYVPLGRFFLNRVKFQGPCKSSAITFHIDGTLIAPGYGVMGSSEAWISFDRVMGLSVLGGTLDGQGTALWACKLAGRGCPMGAASIMFTGSKGLLISGLTSVNSELGHININGCDGVKIQGVKINAASNSPNTDGIHVQMSNDVTIIGTRISTGDDCVSIGPGMQNLWIENISCGPGHGISIGSLGKSSQEPGVQNVTVKTAVFTGTQNGLRIKTWGRASDGYVKGVVFEHAVMQNVQNPIIITQNYCPGNKNCPDQNSGVKISEVTYNDVRGSSATPVAVNFDCSPTRPCSGIGLQDIKLTYNNGPARAFCKHAGGSAAGDVVPPSCL
ncbi:hypothetical protein QJS04_geneDACA006145 [Acorus gramineus]|uniref:Exopolygalacturonase n=1 Tax=Acorus gramineus TaxID=55184 RepID=A0AAV9B3U6_ACOGR|nr:hypothetical protein QJS04_geneDACA006145 [Acorus gramineus]